MLEQGLDATVVKNIQSLLSALLYSTGALRAAPHILAQNEKGQPGLWAFGISGDYPILLVRIRDGESPLLVEALQAFIYWRSHHVTVNLVILNEQETGYALDLHNAIQRQIKRIGADVSLNQRDGIFVLRTDQLQPASKILLETVAGAILDEESGTLSEHVLRLTTRSTHLPEFTPSLSPGRDPEQTLSLQLPENLLMDNGLGGFSHNGREYVIHLKPGQHTPYPWINVIANPQFGFLVSEAGSGCTWAANSGENRLTPWRNDPVTDMPGEALYSARRGDRADLVANALAYRNRYGACYPARGGLFDLREPESWLESEPAPVRRAGYTSQDCALATAKSMGASAPYHYHLLRRMGTWHHA
jgi:cyclic beta-1,2-glucan synthetase